MWMKTGLLISLLFQLGYAQTCSQNAGSRCGAGSRQGLTAAQRNELLREHNLLRNRVASGAETRGNPGPQPAASNMLEMVWDDEMARLAQNWANQCTFAHNLCGGSPGRFFAVGQNIYMSSSTNQAAANMTAAVVSWYDEVRLFSRSSINPFVYGDQTGHYTQVAWAASRYLGCGLTNFRDGSWYRNLIVCDYGPAGNLRGSSMYNTVGRPCTACPSGGCSRNYASLCA